MSWTQAHVRRLHWRAGFGATPAQARYWARAGKAASINHLLNGGTGRTRGRAPTVDGKPLDPENEYNHDVLWWLDRMVRSDRPLQERMTLFWHDHFATTDQDTPLMLRQNKTLRRNALGSFPVLLTAVTLDPAMQMFLSLADSDKDSPNENYARELMELFTLAKGYTETDIREAARALTGFETHYANDRFQGIRYDPERHDGGSKRIFRQRGRHDWRAVLRLCLTHPQHAPFLVTKLWKAFIVAPPSRRTVRDLAATYRRGGRIKPVVRTILEHPALYANLSSPDMIKPPVVLVAGSLRVAGQSIRGHGPASAAADMGQRLFDPPSVAGWDGGETWMSSNSMRARFDWGNYLLGDESPRIAVDNDETRSPRDAARALEVALAAVGRPEITTYTRVRLFSLARHFFDDLRRGADAEDVAERANMLQRALRHALLTGPDNQLH